MLHSPEQPWRKPISGNGLSLVLTAGVIQLFIGVKQTYRFHDALSRLQENGRFAIDSMAADIRMADFGGPASAVSGTDGTTGSSETDSINVAWVEGGNQTRNYSIINSPAFAGTCASAATSLALDRNGGSAQELIEGVQAMRILYGVCADTDGDNVIDGPPTSYVDATTVGAAWGLVCSVRIHLMLVSLDDNIVSQSQTVNFPIDQTTTITPTDRCLRQAFSTTVRIRNRL